MPAILYKEILYGSGGAGSEGGGGASSLTELTDTNIDSPLDGQVLKYDATSQKWVNTTDNSTIVVANPQDTPTGNLTSIQIGSDVYAIPVPTTVTANPVTEATDTLTKLQVGQTVYDIPSGGGSGAASEKIVVVQAFVESPTEVITIEQQT